MKKLLIVNPDNSIKSEFSAKEPPIWAGLYATYARSLGYDVRIHDCQERPILIHRDHIPDDVWVVVMGNNPSASSTPKMPLVIDLRRDLSGITNLKIGGIHPLALPKETMIECGADSILPRLNPTDREVAWDLLPMDIYRAHNWHCLDGSDRGNYASIYTAYGCPFDCNFCNVQTLHGVGSWIPRTIGSVIDEVAKLKKEYGIRNLKIADELFTISPKRIISLCEQLEQFNLNIWAYGRVGMVNPPMLKAMKKAGINWVAYGFESFDPAARGNKKYNGFTEDDTIRMTQDAGINIVGNFIFGLPDDTEDTMRMTLDKAMKYNFEYVNFYVCMPYPGSALWKDSYSHDWSRYDQFSENSIAGQEVVDFRDKAFNEYFTNPDYLSMIEKKFGAKAVEHIKSMLKTGKPRNQELAEIAR